jgi:2-dehydro-3-deoxyglucarate aldolase
LTFGDPAVAEIMAKAGFDWLALDMEHSGLSFEQAQEIIRTIDLCGIPPLVRVGENNANLIKRFMDIGAHGVIVPMVNSQIEAENAVKAVKYPPLGNRGVGLARAQSYSLDLESYRKWNQENSIVIVQIEHIKAVENMDTILKVEGVDGFIVGPYDLSGSLGIPGQFDHPAMQEALQTIKTVMNEGNKAGGFHIVEPSVDKAITKYKEGYSFLAFGVDFLFLGWSCREELKNLRKELKNLRREMKDS